MFQKILAEIMQKIDRYIPRDNDMRSPTAVLINELVHKYKKDKEMQNARMAVDSFFLWSRMGAYLNGESELLELKGFPPFSTYVLRCIITKKIDPNEILYNYWKFTSDSETDSVSDNTTSYEEIPSSDRSDNSDF